MQEPSIQTAYPISISFTEDTEPNFIGLELTFGEYMRGEFEQSEDESQQNGGMQL